MNAPKKKKRTSYNLLLIPEDNRRIRKIRISPKHMRWGLWAFTAAGLLLIFNTFGFWYYQSLYASLNKERQKVEAYRQESGELLNKVASLEKTLNEMETTTEKLAAMVGTERAQMKQGVGPLPPQDFKLRTNTEGIPPIAAHMEDVDPKLDRMEDKALGLRKKIQDLYKIQEDKLIYIASTPSIWPVKGWVTSDFGYRRSPFTLTSDFHGGLDIAAQWGTPIVAPADGTVTFSGLRNGFGKMVIIDHGFGVTTRYGHASSLLVHEGEKIKRGAKIALVGNTGHSTGPHLHYEIHVDGVAIDPMRYILQ